MEESLQRAKFSAGMWLESMSVRRGAGHAARLFIPVQPRDKAVPRDKSFSSRGSETQKSQGETLGEKAATKKVTDKFTGSFEICLFYFFPQKSN